MSLIRCSISLLLRSVICILILSCNDDQVSKITTTNQYKSLRIEINSPYACYNQIHMDSVGLGTTILGFSDANQNKTIKTKKQFYIHSESDKIKINDLISEIKARNPIVSQPGNDLYHFTLIINDQKFIDKYGPDTLLDGVLKVLIPYVQNEDSGQCDYFNILKQILNNTSRSDIEK